MMVEDMTGPILGRNVHINIYTKVSGFQDTMCQSPREQSERHNRF